MRYKSTLLLLVAVIIAGLVAYSLSRKPTSEEAQREQKRLLPGFAADNVASLAIQTDSGKITCERTEADKDRWRITAPLELRADRYEVDSILDKFELADKEGAIYPTGSEPLKPERYGLDSPSATVVFKDFGPTARTRTVRIGRETGVGEGAFAAVEGVDAVFSIKRDVAEKLNVTLNDIRSRKLAERIETSELTGIELSAQERGEKQAYSLSCAKKDGQWEITAPVHDLADSSKVEKLAEAVSYFSLTSADFVVDDPTKVADYGLDRPALSIEFKMEDASRTIIIAERQEGEQTTIYAMNKGEPAIVKVSERLLEDLRKEPDDLRQRSIADFEKDDVVRVTAAGPDMSLVLEKVEGNWQIAGEEPAEADYSMVGDFLDGLGKAEVAEFAADEPEDLATYGLSEQERLRLTAFGKDEEQLCEVLFGKEADDGEVTYAMRPGYAGVLALPSKDYLRGLRTGRLAFLKRLVLQESRSRALRVALTQGQEKFVAARKSDEADWQLLEPVKGPVDGDALDDMLAGFMYLEAAGFVAEKPQDLAPFGLDQPAIRVAVTYRTEKKTVGPEEGDEGEPEPEEVETYVKSLLIGARQGEDGDFFAKLEDDPKVFLLPENTVDDFQAGLASRLICKARDMRRLVFNKGEQSFPFEYDGEAYEWKGPGGAVLDDDLKERVTDAADLLRKFKAVEIESYIVKGPGLYGFDSPYLAVEIEQEATEGKTVVVGKESADGKRFVKGTESTFVLVASEEDIMTLFGPTEPTEEQKPEDETEEEDGT